MRQLMAIAVFLYASLVVAADPPSAAPAPRAITLDDFGRVKSVGEPHFSPDGRSIAFDLDGQIFVVATDDGVPRAVTSTGSSAWSPTWSRDGSALYFLSDRSGKNQLWKLPIKSFGEAIQVTALDRGIDALQFSADESKLLLSFNGTEPSPPDGDAKETPQDSKDKPAEKKPPAPWVITRLHFKEDAGDGYLTGDLADHLYVHDVQSKSMRQLTSGRYSESEAAWSPDGGSIVFASNREQEPDAGYKTDLWIVHSDGAVADRPLARVTNDDTVKSEPQWSPDGRSIAYITAADGVYGIQQLAIVPASGGDPHILTAALDRWVRSFKFSADGAWLYFLYDDQGAGHVGRVRVRDGRIETLIDGPRQVSAFDVAPSGTVAANIENGNGPAELYVLRAGKLRQVTHINDAFLRSVSLGSKQSIEFSSTDGTRDPRNSRM
jgi:Tol biopolymer transport system component